MELQIFSWILFGLTIVSRVAYGYRWRHAPHMSFAIQIPWMVYTAFLGPSGQGIFWMAVVFLFVELNNVRVWTTGKDRAWVKNS